MKRRITENDLERILNGDIDYIEHAYNLDFPLPEIKVVVLPHHVKKILLSYLSSQINADELQRVTEFICYHTGAYIINDPNDDIETQNYYEAMWYVIQKLSTPEIDGEITPETVLLYLSELEKYK